jgi:hypothetical protein
LPGRRGLDRRGGSRCGVGVVHPLLALQSLALDEVVQLTSRRSRWP